MSSTQDVTVIGLGPMGRAMVEAFLDAGHRVTVWNRTASKADDVVAKGAVPAATVAEALTAAELVVLSLTDYQAFYAILEPATAALDGRVLVNLTSDTPAKAREATEWAARHGAVHLTGGVQVPPSGIGNAESSTFYSGPEEPFRRHEATLTVLTGTDYRGEDPGLAPLYYQLQMDLFWASLSSWLHAVAVAQGNGISAEELLPYATFTVNLLPGFFAFYAPRIDAGNHAGDAEQLTMAVASMEHVVDTTIAAGVDPGLPQAVLDLFRRGLAEGLGADSSSSLVALLSGAATTTAAA